jgi:hypothetical protein
MNAIWQIIGKKKPFWQISKLLLVEKLTLVSKFFFLDVYSFY